MIAVVSLLKLDLTSTKGLIISYFPFCKLVKKKKLFFLKDVKGVVNADIRCVGTALMKAKNPSSTS